MIKKVGLVVKSLKESLAMGREINNFLTSRGIEVLVDDWSASKMDLREKACKVKDMKVDLIITLGGDGTILKTISMISKKKIPILGINFGTMGFLTEITPKDWRNSLKKILDGGYKVEELDMLCVSIDGKKVGDALNEAVIMTSMPVKMLHLEIIINGKTAEKFRCDGLIVSTPTGSTAYSMSAGGPILDPQVSAFVITSICPFKSGLRSIVIPQDYTVTVRPIKPKKEALIVVDGEIRGKLPPTGEARFTLSGRKSYFIRMEEGFYEKIRERL